MSTHEVYDFGLRLKALRQNRGLTQQEAASRLGITKNTYFRYENNTLYPSTERLKDLATLFNTSVDYLLGFTEKERKHIYLDDLTPKEQSFLIDVVEHIKKCLRQYDLPDK